MTRTGLGQWIRPLVPDGGGGGGGGGSAAFSGARMVGNFQPSGSGNFIVLPTNTGSFEFDEDTVLHVSYDTDGYTTGHGLADGRFVIPDDGYYRITAHPLFMNPSPGDGISRFQAWLAIDGDHGIPSATDPRRRWAVDYQLIFPDSTKPSLWTPCLTMTEELTAGEEVSLYGRFDGELVGSEGWAGFISFEIARVTGATPTWRGIIQDQNYFNDLIPANTETTGDLDYAVSWDTDGINAGDGTWVIPAGMSGLWRAAFVHTFDFQGACEAHLTTARMVVKRGVATLGADNHEGMWSDNNHVTFQVDVTTVLTAGDVISVTFEHDNCDTASYPSSSPAASYAMLEYLGPEPA